MTRPQRRAGARARATAFHALLLGLAGAATAQGAPIDASLSLAGITGRLAAATRSWHHAPPVWRPLHSGPPQRRLLQQDGLPGGAAWPGGAFLAAGAPPGDPTPSFDTLIWGRPLFGPSGVFGIDVGGDGGGGDGGAATRRATRVVSASGAPARIVARFTAQQQAGLPALPADRSVTLSVTDAATGAQRCSETAPYPAASFVNVGFACPGLGAGAYDMQLTDAGDDQMPPLADVTGAALGANASDPYTLEVPMYNLQLRVGFTTLLWGQSGFGGASPDQPLQLSEPFPASLAAGRVVPRGGLGGLWAEDSTDQEGYMTVSVPNNPSSYFTANFTLDGFTLVNGATQPFAAPPSQQQQQPGSTTVTLNAQQPLLCTGRAVEIYGESGAFPYQNTTGAYYRPNSFCRWSLFPEGGGDSVYLKIDYSGLRRGERLIIGFDPLLNEGLILQPGDENEGHLEGLLSVYGAGIPVLFSTNNKSAAGVGSFSIEWSPGSTAAAENPLQSRLVLSVMCTLLALGGLVLAGILWCICGARRRRMQGAVTVGGPGTESFYPGMRRVPTPVRGLLPRKAYAQPERNPLPGAEAAEADCCSICLVEYEVPEQVIVLPCRHFFHVDCIDTWLKRNSTCPLCKADVLDACNEQQAAWQGRRRRSRHRQHGGGVRMTLAERFRPPAQAGSDSPAAAALVAAAAAPDAPAPSTNAVPDAITAAAVAARAASAGSGDVVLAILPGAALRASSPWSGPAGELSAAPPPRSAGTPAAPAPEVRIMPVQDAEFEAAAAALAALVPDGPAADAGDAAAPPGAGGGATPTGRGVQGWLQGFLRSPAPRPPAATAAAEPADPSAAGGGAVALTVLGPRLAGEAPPGGRGRPPAAPIQPSGASFRSRSPSIVVYAYADNLGSSEGGAAAAPAAPPGEGAAAAGSAAGGAAPSTSPLPRLPGAPALSP